MAKYNKFPSEQEAAVTPLVGELVEMPISLDPLSLRTDILRADGSVVQKAAFPTLAAALADQFAYEGVTAFTGSPPADTDGGFFHVPNKTAFMAWDEAADQIHSSANGIAWIDTGATMAAETYTAGDYSAIADDGAGRTVFIFGNESRFSDSATLATWSLGGALPNVYTRCRLIWDGTQFVATCWRTAVGATVEIFTSTDAVSWSAAVVTTAAGTIDLHQSTFFNSLYITVLKRNGQAALEFWTTASAGTLMTLAQTVTPTIPPDIHWIGILGSALYVVFAKDNDSDGQVYKTTNGTSWALFLDIPEMFFDPELPVLTTPEKSDLALFDSNFLITPVTFDNRGIAFNAQGKFVRIITGDTLASTTKSIVSVGSKALIQANSARTLGNLILIADPANTIVVPNILSIGKTVTYIVTGD